MLTCPKTLNVRVVTVSKKSPVRLLIDRQQGMTSRFPKANKCFYPGRKGRKFAGQFANLRAQRRIVSGVLEQPHNKDPILNTSNLSRRERAAARGSSRISARDRDVGNVWARRCFGAVDTRTADRGEQRPVLRVAGLACSLRCVSHFLQRGGASRCLDRGYGVFHGRAPVRFRRFQLRLFCRIPSVYADPRLSLAQ